MAGDIDGDEEVNNIDVLYIGLGYNEKSPAQASPVRTEWKARHVENWGQEFTQSTGSRNYKHADTNGDGIIDFLDVNAIDLFYNNTYETNKKKTEKGTQLKFVYDIDSLKGKRNFKIAVNLGDQQQAAKDVYGLAFSIKYESAVKASSVEFDTQNSWITKGSNKIQLVKNIPEYNEENKIIGGRIDVAISRTDKIAGERKRKSGHTQIRN